MRKLLRGLAAATALSLAPLAAATVTAAPSQAAAVVNSTVSWSTGLKTKGVHGDYLGLTGKVTTTNDPSGYTSPFTGTVYLQRLAPGARTWVNVGSDDGAGFAYFPDYDKFLGNAAFRLYYAGGTYSPGSSSERTYTPAVSPVIKIQTARIVTPKDVSKRGPRLKVTIKPGFGGKKVTLQGKKGKGWKNLRKAKTNKKGVVFLSVKGNRKGIPYRVVVPGDKNFVGTKFTFKGRQY